MRVLLALRAVTRRRLARLMDAWAARMAALTAAPHKPERALDPLTPGDAEAARAFAHGQLGQGALAVRWRSGSPFAATLGPLARDALYGFGWLDDAMAAEPEDAAALRSIAFDGLKRMARGAGPGWRADLAGSRVIAMAAAWPMLLRRADARQKRALARAFGVHARFLERRMPAAPAGLPALTAAAGLAAAGLVAGDRALAARGGAAMGRAAEALIDGDGGVADRNPETLATAAALIAWAVEAMTTAGAHPDPRLPTALIRAVGALRALRLGDGGLVRLHGARAGDPAGLALTLSRAAALTRSAGVQRRREACGAARVTAGRLTLLIDAAPPPPGPLATASTLALAVSIGRARLFDAIGPGWPLGGDWTLAARATAAFCAVEIGGASSARLASGGWAGRVLGRGFASGPTSVVFERAEDDDGHWVLAEHDGYRRRFGMMVRRRLFLARDGRDLRGEDAIAPADPARPGPDRDFCVRFHLAPEIEARADGDAVALTLPDGAVWRFTAGGAPARLAESVALDTPRGGPTAAQQIVV
ncbi:MAG: heparinase II/III family protein, partial [Rubrimonas sp.]